MHRNNFLFCSNLHLAGLGSWLHDHNDGLKVETTLKATQKHIGAKLAACLATLGVGLAPKAPGTFGSLLAVLVWWAMNLQVTNDRLWAIVIAFIVGTVATAIYEKHYQRHDPKEVVVDELVGQWLALALVPITLNTLVVGFILFRFFDILKPFPIGWIDRNLPGAWGTMLDDVLAGVFAGLILQALVSSGGWA